MEDSDVECTASLLASVREQEVQFERLTRALEEERRGTQRGTLPRGAQQPQQYSTLTRMLDPGHFVEETVTMEEDPDLPASVVSVETSDDGTTRRTETTVKKVVKTVTTRTVIPSVSVSDALSLDGSIQGGNGFSGGSMQGGGAPGNGGGYNATLERMYRGGGGGTPAPPAGNMYMGPPGTATVPRNYHYADSAGGYPRGGGGYGETNNYRSGPPSEAYASLSRMQHMDDRYRSYEDTLDSDVGGGDPYYWSSNAPLAQAERGSMASLDGTLRKGGAPQNWRQPELPEVIAMLNYRLDPVKSNAAAFLQHLTFQNDKMKSDVRRLKGIPALVSLLDHPKKDVHYSACGALKNISFGREGENKVAIKNCDGVPALVRLLRKARDQDLTDCITERSLPVSYNSVVLDFLSLSLSQLVENCVCLLRNLSYQVHREVPGCERYQENNALLSQSPNTNGTQRASCFGSKKGKGYELLFQPEVVRLYTSLLKESKIPAVLEAAAGALQNLCAGRWTYGRYIRAMVRQEKGLSSIAELLEHPQDRVVRGMSGALRNLAIDGRNRELIGELREAQGIEKLVLINKDG
ncbi:UNVERIFIED_CONTAM: hypothetical protein FKN15_006471 [Acipenser sinensis]